MIEPGAVIAQAREWLGTSFLHQGRSRFGCDCLGFIAGVMSELGSAVLMEHLPNNYARAPQQILLDGLESLTHQIDIQPAALLTFQFPLTKFPSHAGIFTGDSVIHCYEAENKVIEHGYRPPWVKRTQSIWALPLVMYQ